MQYRFKFQIPPVKILFHEQPTHFQSTTNRFISFRTMAKLMFLFQITNLITKKQTGTLDRSCHSGYETCMPE